MVSTHRLALIVIAALALPCFARAETPAQREEFTSAVQMMDAGEFVQAWAIFESAWKRRREEAGAQALETIEAQFYHGQALRALGHSQEALNVLGPLAEHFKQRYPPENPQRIVAEAAFAGALREAGEVDQAVTVLRSVAGRMHSAAQLPGVLNELCIALLYAGKRGEAIAACNRALALSGPDVTPLRRASFLVSLGQAHLMQGDSGAAMRTLSSAREVFLRLAPSHPELATVEAATGIAHCVEKRWAACEFNLRAALARYSEILPPAHPEVAMVTHQLSQAVRKQKRKQEARQLEEHARAMLARRNATATVSSWSFRGK